jgi:hypothetical protein
VCALRESAVIRFRLLRRDKNTGAVGQLAERQIEFDAADIGLIDQNRFDQLAFTFCVFGGQQVAASCLRSQYLSARGDLKSFRHRFLGFASGNRLRHKAREDSGDSGDGKRLQILGMSRNGGSCAPRAMLRQQRRRRS